MYATVLHPDHRLVGLNKIGRIDQTLVNVQLGHVVDNDGTSEVLVLVLVLEDILEQCRFARAKEATEQGDGDPAVRQRRGFLPKQIGSDNTFKMGEILTWSSTPRGAMLSLRRPRIHSSTWGSWIVAWRNRNPQCTGHAPRTPRALSMRNKPAQLKTTQQKKVHCVLKQ